MDFFIRCISGFVLFCMDKVLRKWQRLVHISYQDDEGPLDDGESTMLNFFDSLKDSTSTDSKWFCVS